ncbi:hypothetical protein GCM10010193_70020 [Kitasatospora atroaurantiaca]
MSYPPPPPQRQVVKRGANHGLHVFLSIITCGIWAITGWPIAAAMGRKTVTTSSGHVAPPYAGYQGPPGPGGPPPGYGPPQGAYPPPPQHPGQPPAGPTWSGTGQWPQQ